jgi:hypothetical protein
VLNKIPLSLAVSAVNHYTMRGEWLLLLLILLVELINAAQNENVNTGSRGENNLSKKGEKTFNNKKVGACSYYKTVKYQ